MKTIRKAAVSLLLAATVLGMNANAWATDQDKFVASLKKYGVTDSFDTGKKSCLCEGGTSDGKVGRLQISAPGDGTFSFECVIPVFDAQQNFTVVVPCRHNGGSVIVLSK